MDCVYWVYLGVLGVIGGWGCGVVLCGTVERGVGSEESYGLGDVAGVLPKQRGCGGGLWR